VHFKPGVVKTMPSTVVSILVDSEGGVWLGSTWSGVSKMNPETGECTRIGAWVKGGEKIPNAYAMVEDGAGNIWIGTNGDGLYCYRPKTHGLEHYQVREGDEVRYPDRILYNSYITALLVWGDCLYVGMADGMDVFRLTPEGPKRKGRFLPKANVRDMEIGEDGVLWVATSTGLVRFDVKDGSMKSYTAADGLPTNSLCSIERDAGGKVWVGTDDGLACFNPAKETFDNYRIEDGLQGNEFGAKASYAQNGLLYFGGINGLTCFRPSDVGKRDGVNLEKMDLRIVDFYVNGKAVHAGDRSGHYTIIDRWLPLTDEVNLSHHDKSFSVELSTMSFSNSRVTYRYCVNDGEWMALEHGQNRISFVNMEAGTYRIRIKAEAYGESSDVKELTVKVHPVWYLSPLAVMVYCVLFLFICYMVFLQVKEHFKTKRIFEKHRQEEELNEARIQFFMNISHEIRTPMTLILSPLMKLMKQDQDEAHQRSYSLMYQNSQRILRLINQLMDARKIEKGQFRLKYHKVEMVGFVNNLYELFETTARNRGITFCFVHDMERMDVCVDPQNFDKVIMNLLSNAFKFTPDGGDITIELKEVDGNVSGERDFRLSVTDSGVGIPDQEKKRVFERFYSGKWGGDYVGTGIGLNLTKLLVELHEGHIWAENNPKGKGTRFIVQMPQALELLEDISDDKMPRAVYSAPLEAEHVAETVAELPEEKKGGSKHGRILVVEDETAIRRYLHGEFSGEYHVCECSNGQEAWDYIVQNVEKVDLVVSDVMMPVMDGIALCRNIKGSFNTNHIPVILLTAKSDDADRLEGLSIGADAYMSKPFNMDVLRQTAENLLKNKRRLQGKYSVAQQEGKIDKIEWMSPNDQMMERVMKVINENISNPDLGVEFIADKIGISRVHFHRRLKNATGLTPRDFVRNIRLMQAAKLLSRTDTDVTGVSVATGFRSASTFSTCFKAYYGMSPTEYAHKNSKSEDEPENNEGGNVAEDGHEQ
jgi:CheY-like chemotaxis protein/AraC-like DNA-binding protein/nitrogen-specific signal transduction histidine kinase